MTGPRRPFGRSFGRHVSAFQPYTPSDSAPTDQHLETLRSAPANLRKIMADHRTAVTDVRRETTSDGDLTPEGKQARIAQRAQPIHERTAQAVDALDQQTRHAYDTLQQRAAAALPKPATGVEGMLARQAAWSRAQTLLNSGMTPQQVIDEANDPETLHALAEELPTVLRAQGLHPDDANRITDTTDDRLAEITGEPAANARLAAREADVHMAGLEHLVSHARGEAAGQPGTTGLHGTNGLGAAVAAATARQRMAAGGSLPTDELATAPGRGLDAAIRAASGPPTSLRHAINDQMRRAAKRPQAPTDQANGDIGRGPNSVA